MSRRAVIGEGQNTKYFVLSGFLPPNSGFARRDWPFAFANRRHPARGEKRRRPLDEAASKKSFPTAVGRRYPARSRSVVRRRQCERARPIEASQHWKASNDRFAGIAASVGQPINRTILSGAPRAPIVREVEHVLARNQAGGVLFVGHGPSALFCFCRYAGFAIDRIHDQFAGGAQCFNSQKTGVVFCIHGVEWKTCRKVVV